ncbi:hypothetical protein T03_3703 [Trichinella britovi]|uniref:Uncharacterized protein n=1 Tax=Trichinella britovi TaxID=45882 RepID=A0A0V1B873_TRIBR|nr:hypothetical protein T03_3703 [Trichinella britovi]
MDKSKALESGEERWTAPSRKAIKAVSNSLFTSTEGVGATTNITKVDLKL